MGSAVSSRVSLVILLYIYSGNTNETRSPFGYVLFSNETRSSAQPILGGCSEVLDAIGFVFKHEHSKLQHRKKQTEKIRWRVGSSETEFRKFGVSETKIFWSNHRDFFLFTF